MKSLLSNEWQTLLISRDGRGVLGVQLNCPDKRNALSAAMIDEMTELATLVADCQVTRAVVLSGHGKVFCAGGDLNWMKAQINADRATRIIEATKLAMMLYRWNSLPKPVIGAIHGGAYGGGAGLCCVCDVAVATDETTFGFTETKLGLIPGTISPYVIARLGEAHARRVFMSARVFGAQEAKTLGLVASVVTAAEFDEAIEREVLPYLSAAPLAVAESKKLARSLGPTIDQDTIDQSIRHLADVWETKEAAAGIDAFLNRTQPPWS